MKNNPGGCLGCLSGRYGSVLISIATANLRFIICVCYAPPL